MKMAQEPTAEFPDSNSPSDKKPDTARRRAKIIFGCLGFSVVLSTVGAVLAWTWIQNLLDMVNLQYQVGFVARWYAQDHDGAFPPLSPEPGRLMYDYRAIYPDYDSAPNLNVWVRRNDRFRIERALSDDERARLIIDDHSYFYFGYLITNDREARAFETAYRKRIAERGDFSTDLPVPEGDGNFGTSTIYRLREDMEEFLRDSTDAEIPESFDFWSAPQLIARPTDTSQPELGVYRLGGFVDTVPRGAFPASEVVLEVLLSLDSLDASHVTNESL